MVVIRLARGGSKRNPFYQVVVADRRMPRDGRFIERVGHYDPMVKRHGVQLRIEKDRVTYWLGQGAVPSVRVKYLIRQLSVVHSYKKAYKSTMIEELKAVESVATKEVCKE